MITLGCALVAAALLHTAHNRRALTADWALQPKINFEKAHAAAGPIPIRVCSESPHTGAGCPIGQERGAYTPGPLQYHYMISICHDHLVEMLLPISVFNFNHLIKLICYFTCSCLSAIFDHCTISLAIAMIGLSFQGSTIQEQVTEIPTGLDA